MAGVLAAAGAAILGLCWTASSPAAALGISPSPTPCALPPPLTCTLASPVPSLGASPSPTPSSTTGGGGSTSPAAPLTAPKSAPAASQPVSATGTISTADIEVLQSTLANTALVQQLVTILENPIAGQRPDLLHFRPAAHVEAVARAPGAGGDTALAVLALLLPLLWIAAVPLAPAARRPLLLAVLMAPGILAAAGAGAEIATQSSHPAALAATVLPSRSAPPAGVHAAKGGSAPAAWSQLVGIERQLGSEQSELAAIEQRLDQLTVAVENDATDHRVEPRIFASLVAQHDTQAAVYDQNLQQEYLLYRTAALQPAVAEQLRSGATASGIKTAPHDVDANLQTVATQLQQEAAISQAQARLSQLGFTPAQAQAFQGHDSFVAPLGGPIGQPFGPTSFALEPPLVFKGQFYPHFHTGIDIEAPVGAPVVAAADGVVALVATSTDGHGHTTGYGTYVVIAHAHGYFTLYGHLSATLVTAGQVVHQGQPIGLVGTTGNSTGPHLHFEIRRDGEFLDPLPYVTGALKPW